MKHHLTHPLMQRIVALKEREYADARKYDYAPVDFEDAMDSYEKVLEIAGEICGEIVAPNAESVDHEGPRVVDGHVEYASGTARNLDALVKPVLWVSRFLVVMADSIFACALYHGGRYGEPCRCRLCEYLGVAGLCRNDLRVCQ